MGVLSTPTPHVYRCKPQSAAENALVVFDCLPKARVLAMPTSEHLSDLATGGPHIVTLGDTRRNGCECGRDEPHRYYGGYSSTCLGIINRAPRKGVPL